MENSEAVYTYFYMARNFEFGVDEFYHIYNRGNNKQKIFLHSSDQLHFLQLLYLCNSTKAIRFSEIKGTDIFDFDRAETLVDIGAYCILYNHFHLLLHEKIEGGISKFMQKLITAYSMYFRTRYKRVGTIFESSYKAKHIDTDEYLEYLFSYIHLNPVEHIEPKWKEKGIQNLDRAEKYAKEYRFSSFKDFCGQEKNKNPILEISKFPKYFTHDYTFEDYCKLWLKYNPDYHEV